MSRDVFSCNTRDGLLLASMGRDRTLLNIMQGTGQPILPERKDPPVILRADV
jgi:hypothetical protein